MREIRGVAPGHVADEDGRDVLDGVIAVDQEAGRGCSMTAWATTRVRREGASTSGGPGTLSAMSIAYQLKVTLKGTRPPVWRRLVVPGNLNLARLHDVLQDAMGWEKCHLHQFEVGDAEFGPSDLDDPLGLGPSVEPEKRYTLERLVGEKDRFTYLYDFGDSWTHEIRVEKVFEAAPGGAPRCIAGARACPPEDCGGVWGYADIVEALAHDTHERHDEVREWFADWSPDVFDVEATDRRVSRHLPQPGRPRQKQPGGAGRRARRTTARTGA